MANLRWTVGDVHIVCVVETQATVTLAEVIPAATPAALAPHYSWLKPHFIDDDGNCPLAIQAFLIEAGGQRIVVDTCLGEHGNQGFEQLAITHGNFLERIAAEGFAREDVDIVLCTHLHFDHVGWNTMRDGDRLVPTFPNARYLFARSEWEHWRAAEGSPFVPTYAETVEVVMEAGLVDLVDTDHRINGEVRLEPTAGHTPGHVSVCIDSRAERAFITGDMTHHPVQWAEPSWASGADSDGDAAAATRRRIGARYAGSDVLVLGTHYPAPTAGHLVERNGRTIFAAADE